MSLPSLWLPPPGRATLSQRGPPRNPALCLLCGKQTVLSWLTEEETEPTVVKIRPLVPQLNSRARI